VPLPPSATMKFVAQVVVPVPACLHSLSAVQASPRFFDPADEPVGTKTLLQEAGDAAPAQSVPFCDWVCRSARQASPFVALYVELAAAAWKNPVHPAPGAGKLAAEQHGA
jgi:hypothetical protein